MMSSFYLETERLYLRRFYAGDWKDLYEYLAQEETVKFEPYGVQTALDCEKEAIRRAEDETFLAVCLKDTGKLIGNLYFSKTQPDRIMTWELGYVFNSNYWGMGYASEACRAILRYAFYELNAHRVIAMCNTKNFASWKLLESLRFRREGHLIKNMYFDKNSYGSPIWNDTYEYALLADEYITRELL